MLFIYITLPIALSGSDLGGTMLSQVVKPGSQQHSKTFHLLSGVWVCLRWVPLITVCKRTALITYIPTDAIFSHRLYNKGDANAACLNNAIKL